MTTTVRLTEKGMLQREGVGQHKKITYVPALSEQAFVAGWLADIIGAVGRDNSTVLAQALNRRPAPYLQESTALFYSLVPYRPRADSAARVILPVFVWLRE